MKLLTYEHVSRRGVGASVDQRVIDLTSALAVTHPELTGVDSLLSIIRSGLDIDTIGGECIERLRRAGKLMEYVLRDFIWLPPVMRPPKILALAMNFADHATEMPELGAANEPILFEKYPSNMVGNGGNIVLPPFPQRVDEECELAVVLGRPARHLLPSEADEYIFGYTICNDVSARERQQERIEMGQPYSYAKNFATFCPMGPWVVTRRELRDPSDLAMRVRVNGRLTRSGSTRDMIFNAQQVVAYCSDYTLLEPGDVLSLGTFAGDKQLRPGEVELEIEGIGVLRNHVVPSEAPWRNFPAGSPSGAMVKEP